MKKALLYVLLFYPVAGWAQLSEDSLKEICRNLYQKERDKISCISNPKEELSHTVSADELFKGYFNDVKIFLLTEYSREFFDKMQEEHEHTFIAHHYMGHRLYFLNAGTGKEVEIKDIQTFNNVFGKNPRLCNLDKCYLYLLAVANIKGGMTSPEFHRDVLNKNSIFYKDAIRLFHEYWYLYSACNRDDHEIITNIRSETDAAVNRATKRSIYVYVVNRANACSCTIASVYSYHFIFENNGNIKDIEVSQHQL